MTGYMKWTNVLKYTTNKLAYGGEKKKTENLNISVTIREIEFAIKTLPKMKTVRPDDFPVK